MSGDDNRTRVLLRPDVTEEMIEDLALDLGWVMLGSHPPPTRHGAAPPDADLREQDPDARVRNEAAIVLDAIGG